MEDKKCCGIYDCDGVIIPGEELIDRYVWKICKEASNAYCDELFNRQNELIQNQQRLEQERDVFGPEMIEITRELEEINKKIKRHFILKDIVLEEVEEKYKNKIDYKEIYQRENIYQGVLELFWQIYDSHVYDQIIVNTHVNAESEIIWKREMFKKDFPPLKFVPVKYHLVPYKDPFGGLVNKNRKPSDKIGRLINMSPYIDVDVSTFIDNTSSIIKRGKEIGLNCYYVKKNLDPYVIRYPILNPIPAQIIMQAANDTIDKVHNGKIKKLSL